MSTHRPGPFRTARGLALATLLLVATAPASRALDAGEGAPTGRQAQAASPEDKLADPEAILTPFAEGEIRTRVIVNLAPSALVAGFAAWDDTDALAVHRDAVASVVDDFLDGLPSDAFEVRRRYDNQTSLAGWATEIGLDAILSSPLVDTVEADELIQLSTRQGIPQMSGTTPRATYGGAGVSVAIADTGIDYSHTDMGGGGFPNSKVIGGYDFGDDDTNPFDFHGHGTSAAGVAAGDTNNQGDYIGGVAPSAKLYALKISLGSSGSAYTSDMIGAWDWSITHKNDDPGHPILVVNTSFGNGTRYVSPCNGSNPAQTTSANNLVAAGIALFCSSGNEGYCDGLAKPACISSAISVGAAYDANLGSLGWCVKSGSCVALPSGCSSGWQCNDMSTALDQVTCYSNSASFLDLLAPSNDARAPTTGGGYTGFGGTSAASPYAAGAAAVLQSAAMTTTGSFLSAVELRSLLVQTGDPVYDTKSALTKPRVNLENAVAAIAAPNDFCANAIAVEDGLTAFSNVGATTDGPDEPTLCDNGATSQIDADVWFCYTAPCTGSVSVGTCDADFNTKIAVYSGCSCPSVEAAIACNDDACSGDRASVSFDAVGGDSYLVRVGGYLGAEGSGNLSIQCIPANDACVDALTVTTGTIPFSNRGATTDGPDEPAMCSGSGDTQVQSDVWFHYTAPCSGQATVSLCSADFDTKVAIYDGVSCPGSGSAIACDDDTCGDRSVVTFDALFGQDYLIRVGGFGGAQGTGTMSVTCDTAFDVCEGAGELAAGSTPFTTLGATTDGPDEPPSCEKNGDTQIGSDIWYRYTATCTGEVTMSLCSSDYDTKLAVYSGTDCPTTASAIACDDDECGVQSEVTFFAISGETYLVRIGGFEAAQGTGTVTVSCEASAVDQCQGIDGVNKLRVNFDDGTSTGHVVPVDGAALMIFALATPPAGGNGKFVVHLNDGAPSQDTLSTLPAQLGTFCFPALIPGGASPLAIWNNLGKVAQIGASHYFGDPIDNPQRAPTTFFLASGGDPTNFPVGSLFTLQGVIVNPDATSPKGVSVTNAIVLMITN